MSSMKRRRHTGPHLMSPAHIKVLIVCQWVTGRSLPISYHWHIINTFFFITEVVMAGVKGMYQPGNFRKSKEQHELEGTTRSYHTKKEVEPTMLKRLEFDPFLAGETDLSEKQVFNALSKYLFRNKMTTEVDKYMLSQWSTLYCIQRDIYKKMKAEGWEAMYGKQMAHIAYRDVCKDIRVLLAEYNLTPNTRHRNVQIEEEKPKDNVISSENKFLSKIG